jgi:hypothetical protein
MLISLEKYTSNSLEEVYQNNYLQPFLLTLKSNSMNLKRYTLILSVMAWCTLTHAQAPTFLKKAEAQAYKASNAEVKKAASIATGDQMAELILKYKLNASEQQAIRALIEERETRMATYNVLYPEDDTTRYKAKQAVEKEYRDAITRTLFTAGKTVGCYNCRMIMRNKDTLRLTPSQQEMIIAMAVEVDRLLEADPKMELRPYEMPRLTKIMTPTQFDLYLTLKLNDEVKGQIQATWKKLTDNGLEYGMDSTLTARELYNYHLSRDKAIYIYYNDTEAKDAALKAINDAAPLAIRRANSVADAVKAKNAYNGTLTW